MSEADKKITIGIKVDADTKGAKDAAEAIDQVVDKGAELEQALEPTPGTGLEQIPKDAEKAEKAIEEVTDSAQDAGRAVDRAGNGPGIKKLPQEAKAAEGSIEALEDEVQRLNRELNKLPVGSAEFVKMAGRVKEAQQNLARAETEARKLAGTVGSRGNAGLAVLEFSRAFEDAQYGIRGVLNNLPGLITMLGGGAGLAGVISIAAVAGTYLWEKFGSGAKDAKKETGDVLDLFKELVSVYNEFENIGKADREAALESLAEGLSRSLRGNQSEFKIEADTSDLDAAREKGVALVQLAQQRLELSRIDAALLNASGEQAVKLAKDREEVLKRIYQTELQIAEIPRKAALAKAEAKVSETTKNLDATNAVDSELAQTAAKARAEVEVLRAQAEQLRSTQTGLVNMLRSDVELKEAELKKLQEQADAAPEGSQSSEEYGVSVSILTDEIKHLNDRIGEVLLDNRSIADVDAQVEAKQPTLTRLEEELASSAKAQSEAARAQAEATIALKNLRQTQGIERQTEAGQKAVDDVAGAERRRNEAGLLTRDEVNQGLTGLEGQLREVANLPPVRKMIDDIKALAADGIQAGEQTEVTILVQQLVSQIKNRDEQTPKLFQQLLAAINSSVDLQNRFGGEIGDLKNRVKSIEQNLRGK